MKSFLRCFLMYVASTKHGRSVKLIRTCVLSAASAMDFIIFSLEVKIDVYLILYLIWVIVAVCICQKFYDCGQEPQNSKFFVFTHR